MTNYDMGLKQTYYQLKTRKNTLRVRDTKIQGFFPHRNPMGFVEVHNFLQEKKVGNSKKHRNTSHITCGLFLHEKLHCRNARNRFYF